MTVPIDVRRTMSRRGLLAVMASIAGAAVAGRLSRPDDTLAAGDRAGSAAGAPGPEAIPATDAIPTPDAVAALSFSAGDGLHDRRTLAVGPDGIRAVQRGHWSHRSVTIDGTVKATGGGAEAAGVGPMIIGEGDTMGVYGSARTEGPGVMGRGLVGVEGVGRTGVSAAGEDGPGIRASGERGGTFAGNVAQLQLQPSDHATHPAHGEPGDLFVDASRRLWFCKGGSTWTQVA